MSGLLWLCLWRLLLWLTVLVFTCHHQTLFILLFEEHELHLIIVQGVAIVTVGHLRGSGLLLTSLRVWSITLNLEHAWLSFLVHHRGSRRPWMLLLHLLRDLTGGRRGCHHSLLLIVMQLGLLQGVWRHLSLLSLELLQHLGIEATRGHLTRTNTRVQEHLLLVLELLWCQLGATFSSTHGSTSLLLSRSTTVHNIGSIRRQPLSLRRRIVLRSWRM